MCAPKKRGLKTNDPRTGLAEAGFVWRFAILYLSQTPIPHPARRSRPDTTTRLATTSVVAPNPAEACVAADMSCVLRNRVIKPANGTTRLRNLSSWGNLHQ